MRISHSHKFIWVSKPKTGSTSYRKILDPYSDIKSMDNGDFYHHSSLNMIEKSFNKNNWDINQYKIIVPCRNPYKLLVSLFLYAKMDINGIKWWQRNASYQPDKPMSLKDFLTRDENILWFKTMHTIDTYSRNKSGTINADLIFDPSFQEDKFKTFMAESCGIDLRGTIIPFENTTKKTDKFILDVKKTLSEKTTTDLIENIFISDIKLFNYKNPFK